MSDMVNTSELRFVARFHPSLRDPLIGEYRPVLQQRWVKVGTLQWEELTKNNSEWRDVPLVEEP